MREIFACNRGRPRKWSDHPGFHTTNRGLTWGIYWERRSTPLVDRRWLVGARIYWAIAQAAPRQILRPCRENTSHNTLRYKIRTAAASTPDRGAIGDVAFRSVEAELDMIEFEKKLTCAVLRGAE